MLRKTKAQARAEWMSNFETALKIECYRRGLEFPAGRIDWTSPSYYYLNGEGFATAVSRYVNVHLTKPE